MGFESEGLVDEEEDLTLVRIRALQMMAEQACLARRRMEFHPGQYMLLKHQMDGALESWLRLHDKLVVDVLGAGLDGPAS